MIALIQRVTVAEVRVRDALAGAIGPGILALIGIERADTPESAAALLERVLCYRIFPDAQGRMNLSLRERAGGLLLVPQFTLAADTHKGSRAGFSSAAEAGRARELFTQLVEQARALYTPVSTGVFGEHMEVSLVNDGPVTFWLQTAPPKA
jgi:D-tyrosyl-tRNA(Tyr) deacylase